jgi:hypothetical protein
MKIWIKKGIVFTYKPINNEEISKNNSDKLKSMLHDKGDVLAS